jgi:hypothetical protein
VQHRDFFAVKNCQTTATWHSIISNTANETSEIDDAWLFMIAARNFDQINTCFLQPFGNHDAVFLQKTAFLEITELSFTETANLGDTALIMYYPGNHCPGYKGIEITTVDRIALFWISR